MCLSIRIEYAHRDYRVIEQRGYVLGIKVFRQTMQAGKRGIEHRHMTKYPLRLIADPHQQWFEVRPALHDQKVQLYQQQFEVCPSLPDQKAHLSAKQIQMMTIPGLGAHVSYAYFQRVDRDAGASFPVIVAAPIDDIQLFGDAGFITRCYYILSHRSPFEIPSWLFLSTRSYETYDTLKTRYFALNIVEEVVCEQRCVDCLC